MKSDCRHALALALERDIGVPGSGGSWFCINAQDIPDASVEWKLATCCEQGFRPAFLELEARGFKVEPELPVAQHTFENGIVFLGRNRRLNEYNIVRAMNLLPKGGRLLVAGNKTDGVGAVRKWSDRQFTIASSFSKYHAVVFWIDKGESKDISLPDIALKTEGFRTAEGMFSAGRIDNGSLMLAQQLNGRISGRVADLGAGWGYLSAKLLEASEKITDIDLFEADYASIHAARRNLSDATRDVGLTFNWIDVTVEFQKKPYDWVIMNPPFHTGRAADPGIGKRFIEVASSTLASGGRLLMVANRNLPYEETLKQHFRRQETLMEADGFKVIEAIR